MPPSQGNSCSTWNKQTTAIAIIEEGNKNTSDKNIDEGIKNTPI